ncbi:putative harbinger transposase-derived protein [Helianthus annuus]|nr:putative harbinger transposase-derived protein [Helianthus annuus]
MSSSSYSESSSSSDDGAEIFLQTIVMVVKAIVEDEDDEEETQQPKQRRRYIARERHTANDLLPSFSDMQQILDHHADYHGLPGMLDSLDCMKWPWELCPTQWQGAHTSGFHGVPTIMIEAVASQDLWIWHAFFGMPGSHNDITIINHSPLLNDRVNGIGPKGTFFVNGIEYMYGYYQVDGIYPEWGVFVKSFTRHGTSDWKRDVHMYHS